MKKQYYIIGSGGFAKEVYFLAENTLDSSHQFMGFIDKNPSVASIKVRGRMEEVIDEDFFLDNVLPNESLAVYNGVGDPNLLLKLTTKFKDYNFPNLIHSNFVGDTRSIVMGKGNIITAGCIFTVDISIGSFNIFNLSTTVGHDTIIGDCNIFNPGVNISGGVVIGNANLFGTNSTVLQLIQIKDRNILGASSMANKNIENDAVMIGSPAKLLVR